jgi:hypothetical protein
MMEMSWRQKRSPFAAPIMEGLSSKLTQSQHPGAHGERGRRIMLAGQRETVRVRAV